MTRPLQQQGVAESEPHIAQTLCDHVAMAPDGQRREAVAIAELHLPQRAIHHRRLRGKRRLDQVHLFRVQLRQFDDLLGLDHEAERIAGPDQILHAAFDHHQVVGLKKCVTMECRPHLALADYCDDREVVIGPQPRLDQGLAGQWAVWQ